MSWPRSARYVATMPGGLLTEGFVNLISVARQRRRPPHRSGQFPPGISQGANSCWRQRRTRARAPWWRSIARRTMVIGAPLRPAGAGDHPVASLRSRFRPAICWGERAAIGEDFAEASERGVVQRALARLDGNLSRGRGSARLNQPRDALHRKLKQLAIRRPD